MVFAPSCMADDTLGTAIVVPVRADCCETRQLIEEAQHLWSAEADTGALGAVCGSWGRVCLLTNPDSTIPDGMLSAWEAKLSSSPGCDKPLPAAKDEGPIVDTKTGLATFRWPLDCESKRPLTGFDLLLMTATPDAVGAGLPIPELKRNSRRLEG
jgi:hypothetical protein